MSRPLSAAAPLIPANAAMRYEVTRDDLPLSCPMPDMYLWNSHPRVFLPIEKTGWAKCPYCGAEYTLIRGDAARRHVRTPAFRGDPSRSPA